MNTDFLATDNEESADFPDSGIRCHTTPAGHRVITLDYWAIPARRKPSWRTKMEASLGSRRFRREFSRDWASGTGDPYYPEFAENGRERYVVPITKIPTGVTLFRGFDLGGRHPACVWGAYSPAQDRVWVFREFDPNGLGTHHFRDAVMYLSGDLDAESLEDLPRSWVDQFSFRFKTPAPWFERGLPWENVSGHEALNTQANAAKDPRDATAASIFATGGIVLVTQGGPVKARHEVLRRLLHIRPDGYPGILIDPSCETTIAALNGGLTYRKQTQANPLPDMPRKDGVHDDLIDALTYAICALVPSADRPLPRPTGMGMFLPKSGMDDEPLVYGYENAGYQPKHPPRGVDWR